MNARFVPFERPRGQPLLVFAMVLGGWLVLRVLLWEAPSAGLAPARAIGDSLATEPRVMRRTPALHAAAAKPALQRRKEGLLARHSEVPHALTTPGAAVPSNLAAVAPPEVAAAFPQDTGDCGRAGLSFDSSPGTCDPSAAEPVEIARSTDVPSATFSAGTRPRAQRWSGDAWLFLREDSAAPLAAGRPAYGRSQAGAVLRYRLAPSSRHRPVLYARATRALAGTREGEVAAGFAARPLPDLPVSVSAELRVYDSLAGRELRPAAFAVTELPPAELPFGFRGEAYAQGGYVGGTFATAFVDGQVRADKEVVRLGDDAELRFGAAASGGAQRHAERLDLGPSAAISFRLVEAHSRLVFDYRFRVAGDAEPRSGPALTFSAGF